MGDNYTYCISKHLYEIKREEGYAVYHSFFGNLCLLDISAFNLLKSFQKEKAIQEVLEKYKDKTNKKKAEELINIFIKKGFLFESKEDELSKFKEFVEKREQSLSSGKEVSMVQLVVANTCNFNCKYCFVDTIYCSEERKKTQKDAGNKIMKKQDAERYIKTVINHIKKNGGNDLFIQFFGGEPLMNMPVITDILEKFSDGKDYGIKIQYSVVSNGFLINDEIAKYFKKYNVLCIVSIDSLYETERTLSNGKNGISKVIDNIKILSVYKNRIAIHTAITTNTSKYFSKEFNYNRDLIDFSIENNVNEIGLIFDFNFDFYEKYSTREILDKFWKFYEYGRGKNVSFTGYWNETFEILQKDRHYLKGGYKTCYATGPLLSIEPSGVVYACKGSSAYFGHMDNFEDIFKSQKYLEYSTHPFKDKESCKNCEIENFCSNICPGSREKNYGTISKMHESTCNLYKSLIKKLIENLKQSELDFITF